MSQQSLVNPYCNHIQPQYSHRSSVLTSDLSYSPNAQITHVPNNSVTIYDQKKKPLISIHNIIPKYKIKSCIGNVKIMYTNWLRIKNKLFMPIKASILYTILNQLIFNVIFDYSRLYMFTWLFTCYIVSIFCLQSVICIILRFNLIQIQKQITIRLINIICLLEAFWGCFCGIATLWCISSSNGITINGNSFTYYKYGYMMDMMMIWLIGVIVVWVAGNVSILWLKKFFWWWNWDLKS